MSDPRLFCADRRAHERGDSWRPCVITREWRKWRRSISRLTRACVDFPDLASSTPAIMAGVFVEAVRSASARDGRPHRWRRKARWSSLTAYRSRGEVSLWETHAGETGRVQLLNRRPAVDRAARLRLAESVADLEGVEQCDVPFWSRRITVLCGPSDGPPASSTVDRIERILEGLRPAGTRGVDFLWGLASSTSEVPATGVTGWKRLKYLAMAGGAFGMTLVGLVIPGVPTVPFLLATSYCLAIPSPEMDERLRRTAFVGPILQEWEGHAALSRTSKGKLIGLTVAIVAVTVIRIPFNPLAVGAIVLVSSISIFEIVKMPALTNDARAAVGNKGRRALPTPAC